MTAEHTAYFRFYAELNDFLPSDRRRQTLSYAFRDSPAIKDTIEALGVPHTEVDLILVNGASVGLNYHLQDTDAVSVYPVFESLDVSSATLLRPRPLRCCTFILDVHLGKLARLLRMLGFDCSYDNQAGDAQIVARAQLEHRIILTRDVGLLKHKAVSHGYWVRSLAPIVQAREILARFDLKNQVQPFRRCLVCNGLIETIDREEVSSLLPPYVLATQDAFYACPQCGRIYWRGTHCSRMRADLERILAPEDDSPDSPC